MRLFNQATAECQNLWNILPSLHPDGADSEDYLLSPLVPFDLIIFKARTYYWANDPYAYLDELSNLQRACARISSQSNSADRPLWRERGSRLGLLLAAQLAEMQVGSFLSFELLDFHHRLRQKGLQRCTKTTERSRKIGRWAVRRLVLRHGKNQSRNGRSRSRRAVFRECQIAT